MRTCLPRLLASIALASGAAALAACTGDLFHDTTWADATGSTTGTTGTGSACDDALGPSEDACVVREELGVFVRNEGDDAAEGTREAPVESLARAIEIAASASPPKRVYACAQTFAEAIDVPGGVSIYGGLDCQGGTWAWIGAAKPTSITPEAGLVPITLRSGAPMVLEDLVATAVAAADPGSSAIACIADGATATLERCELVAGDAQDGAAATDQTGMGVTGDAGLKGGNACSSAAPVAGGAVVTNTCGGLASAGGAGGTGGTTTGGSSGASGTPAGAAGQGGTGQPQSGTWACDPDGNGVDGESGGAGDDGPGGSGDGAFSADGYAGAPGSPGTPGLPGQGGGGGGGTKGVATTCMYNTGTGGGSGGAGGCGGAPGAGGGAGGSSIALLAIDAPITLLHVKLTAGLPGAGGQGALGQAGGPGGPGGPGGDSSIGSVLAGCPGGDGGPGGPGGNGGGGRGGHSFGIALHGTPVEQTAVTFFRAILGGKGGKGGGGAATNAGLDGLADDVFAF